MKPIELSGNDLALAVARAESISVEMRRGRVARKLPFSPEGPAHEFESPWMWRYYDPSTDDTIAGPIIDKHKISTQYIGDDTWAGIYKTGATLINAYAKTRLEAAMRVYCAIVYGDSYEPDGRYRVRTAVVRISGLCSSISLDTFFEYSVEVEATTDAEAEKVAEQHAPGLCASFTTTFIEWKD